MSIELLNLLSLASVDMHTSQVQPNKGTPVEVPVPRKITFFEAVGFNFYGFGFSSKSNSF